MSDTTDTIMDVFNFTKRVLPAALGLVEDLFGSTGGDATEAIRNIQDRRDEVKRNRDEVDRLLAEKHRNDE